MNEEDEKEYRKIRYQQIFDLNNQLSQMGILRYQSITIIGSISITIFGLILALTDKVQNIYLVIISLIIFLLIIVVGFFIYTKQTRKNMEYLIGVIKEIPDTKPGQPFKTPKPKGSPYWPEILYGAFIIGILFFILSLFNF